MSDNIIQDVANLISDDEWRTHGLQDVRIGVTREGLAATKRRLAERIVEKCAEWIAAHPLGDVDREHLHRLLTPRSSRHPS